MKKYLIGALALICLCNAVVFARVLYNRSGTPIALTLTERELHLPYRYGDSIDNTGIRLELEWRTVPYLTEKGHSDSSSYYYYLYPNRLSLTDELAQQLKISLEQNKNELCGSSVYRNRKRSLQVWLALEWDGIAYQEDLRQTQIDLIELENKPVESRTPSYVDHIKQFRAHSEGLLTRYSRLYVVDAALERTALTSKYHGKPNFILVPGLIYEDIACNKQPYVVISEVLSSSIHVPFEHRDVVDGLERLNPYSNYSNDIVAPRFSADIAFGKLGEPWIVAMKKLR